ncbi:unnamed protein product [Plutella xylostella]|uniref:(diamondback moth) hypothetical protein n=1 Tax=Plutella xylostella TaxID=51655 RepID=A0A8S4G885_PLUXY|nr:unnamed protein product [Plutella xylostella]
MTIVSGRRRRARHSAGDRGRANTMEAAWTALVLLIPLAAAEILTPPYFNLALGKRITATATCGDEGRELYCKLVGANADHDEPINVIQGQICDYCDAEVDSQKHPPEYAVDDMETWWQSPPLSRGMKYNEVNVTIDLGQEFHVAYVFVRMGNSPRPGLWALEKSTDYGKTFKPWQYFSDSPQDCERYFGKESIQPITRDDSVICSTEYSKIVPLEGGEIPISLLNYRPSSNKYFNSSVLQEWTRATNVRLRLLRTKNLLGHLMSVARQDPTVTRRYFYSIKDIEIGGRCMCNGHADNCDPSDTTNILVCRCHHNTCGPQCAECCPGFEQKKWRISQNWDRFDCEPCNCHNHSTECVYDPEIDANGLSLDIHGNYEGGGVCQNCQHNTEGINCNKCKPTFYRPYGKQWGELDVCAPCECDPHFSTGNCAEETGQCECRVEFNPPNCDSCAYGYFDYPDCKPCTCNLNGTEGSHCTPIGGLCPCKFNYAGKSCEICADGYYSSECKSCECNTVGSVSTVCDKDSGNCTCRSKYAGRTCNQCEAGYYNYPTCSHCNCDTSGTLPNICDDVTGQCICKEGFGGARCDQCISGYYMEVRGRERVCVSCNCSAKGSTSTSCSADGKCNCLSNFGGKQCDQCSPGYYKYPDCLPCYCDVSGSIGSTCDDNGDCHCRPNFDGNKCDHCKEHFYNYPACEECNCDPRGVIPSFAGEGLYRVLQKWYTKLKPTCEACWCNFDGNKCDHCKEHFYNYPACEECNCDPRGVIPSFAGEGLYRVLQKGYSKLKPTCAACWSNFDGNKCDHCKEHFYNYPACEECNCDPRGVIPSFAGEGLYRVLQKSYTKLKPTCAACWCNFDSNKCDHCKEHFYNYPACEECNCDPRGVIPSFAGCGSVPAGELCQCKDRVQGRICNDCKPLYWNLQEYNPNGCEECDCHLAGTLGGLGSCNTKNGQCICKHNVGERRCDQCQDGYYRLETDNVFGCTECDCDIGGSTDNNCDKLTGQCRCNSRVEGRRCDQPIRAHYFPTLHQFQYEVEEGQTPSGAVRYRSSEEVFPGYSWKGYVVFSLLQNEVINEVHISKSSLYRMVLKYVNPLKDPVTASIIITPESIGDIQQKFSVLLRPTVAPQLVTVAGDKGNSPAPFVMNPGNWTVTIKTTKEVMIDYFVLIPEAYYEATVLTKLVNKPCEIGDNKLCRHFEYPSLDGFPYADVSGLMTSATSYIDNPLQLNELNASATDIPLMNDLQPELQYKMVIEPSGPYVLLVQYVTPVNATAQNEIATNATFEISAKGIVTVRFQSGEGTEEAGVISFNSCPYTAPCRQLVLDERANARLFRVTDSNNVVYLDGEPDTLVGIKSIVAVPEAEWQVDYMTGRAACLRRDGQCVPAVFSGAVDSKKLEAESGVGGDRLTRPPILDNSTVVVQVTPAAPLALEGRVPAPQDYVLLLHYYQPHHPATNPRQAETKSALRNHSPSERDNSGRHLHCAAHVAHCPSTSGCRALVQAPGESLPLQHNFTLTLQSENKGVWLDYILVVAAADYVDSVVKEANMLDYTREFISKCSMNHYQVATTDVGFCRDAVFSITADYNSGTLRCFCDVEGSLDLECDSFGGQCRCRPNVIGRTCSACKTGYYGFPDCKPCNCPSTAICDDDGLCICPKNVEGENCDRCKPYTFNFDVQRGCDDCNCNPLGVRGERLQCHADSGNCECKENVMGRVCDHCVPGHYAFPDCYQCHCDLAGTTDDVCDQNTAQCFCKKYVTGQCHCDLAGTTDDVCDQNTAQCFCKKYVTGQCHCDLAGTTDDVCDQNTAQCFCKKYVTGQCHCDLAGTTDDVCDQNTAQCFCKKYVTGQSCDMCKEEYFNLQPDSPDGCTKCHCFGKTTRCSSAQLYWAEISGMWNWSLVNMEFERSLAVYPHTTPPSLLNHTVIVPTSSPTTPTTRSFTSLRLRNITHRIYGKTLYPDLFYFDNNRNPQLVNKVSFDLKIILLVKAEGKRLTSYGGYLKYSIFYTTQSGNGHAISAPDVVLGGSSGYIVHNSVEQPPSVENWEHAVRIAESDFTNVDGSAVSRDQLMNVLLNLTAIYIRATYWHEAVTTRAHLLHELSLPGEPSILHMLYELYSRERAAHEPHRRLHQGHLLHEAVTTSPFYWSAKNSGNTRYIDAVRQLIKEDRHVTYEQIRASLSIGMTAIQTILHEELGVKKLVSRWVPHRLTEEQKVGSC